MFTEAYAGAPVCAPSRCTLVSISYSIKYCKHHNDGGHILVCFLLDDRTTHWALYRPRERASAEQHRYHYCQHTEDCRLPHRPDWEVGTRYI